MRRARGRGRCRRRAPRGSRARRTRACPRRAACASSCDPAPAAPAPRPACRAAPATSRRPVARRGDLYASAMSLPGCPGRSRKPPAASRIVPPTSRPRGWALTYADVDRISDEVAVGLARARRRRGRRRRRSCCPPGPEYLLAYAAAAKLGAITAGVNDRLSARERDAILAVAGPRSSSPPTMRRRRIAPRPCSHGCASRAPRRPRSPTIPTARSRSSSRRARPGCRRARSTATANSRSSPRPTSATRGTAAGARSAARRSRTSAS